MAVIVAGGRIATLPGRWRHNPSLKPWPGRRARPIKNNRMCEKNSCSTAFAGSLVNPIFNDEAVHRVSQGRQNRIECRLFQCLPS